MITGIKLRHFKSHESTELDFTAGTNLIIGQMGSGKTSIIDAMCFALFGTFPTLKSRRVTLEDIIMARPTKYTETSVEVKFEAQGANYSVERVYRKGEALAYLRSGGQIIEAGPQRVTETVERLLQVDYELFTRAVYSEQNKLDWFLSLGKGERKKYFDELLGISRFETARSSSTAVLNKLKAYEAAWKAFLQGVDATASREQHATLLSQCDAISKSLQECAKELKSADLARLELDSKVASLEGKEKDYRLAIQQEASINAGIGQLNALIESYRKESGLQLTLQQMGARRKQLESAIVACRENKEKLRKAQNNFEKSQGEFKQLEAELLRLSEFSDADESRIEAELSSLQGNQSKSEEALRTQLSLLSSAKQAAGRLDAWLKESKAVETELSALQKSLEQLNGPEAPSTAELAQAADELRGKLAAASENLSRSEQSLHLLSEGLEKCPVCHSALDKGGAKELHSKAQELKVESQREIVRLKASLEHALVELSRAQTNQSRKESVIETIAQAHLREQKISSELGLARKESAVTGEVEKKVAQLQGTITSVTKQRIQESQRLNGAKEFKRLTSLTNGLRESLEKSAGTLSQLEGLVKPGEEEAFVHEMSLLDKAEQADGWKQKVAKLSVELEAVLAQISKIAFAEDDLRNARAKSQDAAGRQARYSSEEKSLSRELSEKSAQLKNLTEKVKQLELATGKAQQVQTVQTGMQKLQNALEETQGALRADLVASLNEASAALWKSIYPYGDYPNLRLVATEDDYSLELQALDGTWMAIESASGGERVCAALCLRVALALVLSPKLSIIILDEPTHNMDSTAVNVLSRALHDELPKFVNQTFLITHDESLKESASSRIYLVDRDKDAGDKSMVDSLSTE